MDLKGWNERFRSQNKANPGDPTPLVARVAAGLKPGRALDLACGSGRNALWLAEQGWRVTAVDGAEAAIAILRERSQSVEAVVADLAAGEFPIGDSEWDLVVIAYYLQRELIGKAKAGVKPGGTLIIIVHITEGDEEPTAYRLGPGELRTWFQDWEIIHEYEGAACDKEHRRSVAEIAAQRPVTTSLREARFRSYLPYA